MFETLEACSSSSESAEQGPESSSITGAIKKKEEILKHEILTYLYSSILLNLNIILFDKISLIRELLQTSLLHLRLYEKGQ